MRGMSLSGGGSRIDILLAAGLYFVERDGVPDWYAGVSSGLLAAIALELGVAKQVLADVMDDKVEWMKERPVTNDGKMTWRAIWNIICGRNYLGKQNVEAILRHYISEERWQQYRDRLASAPIYGMAVSVETGEKWMADLRTMGYEQMQSFVAASCAVPLWMECVPMVKDGVLHHWCDGGWRDHNPSVEAMKLEDDCRMLISISTRPYFDKDYPTGALGMLKKIIAGYSVETSIADEMLEESYCQDNGISRQFYRLPDCKNHQYDTDPERSKRSVEMALRYINDSKL